MKRRGGGETHSSFSLDFESCLLNIDISKLWKRNHECCHFVPISPYHFRVIMNKAGICCKGWNTSWDNLFLFFVGNKRVNKHWRTVRSSDPNQKTISASCAKILIEQPWTKQSQQIEIFARFGLTVTQTQKKRESMIWSALGQLPSQLSVSMYQKHCNFLRHYKHVKCQTLHAGSTYGALPRDL